MFKKCTIAVALLAALTACSSSNDKPSAQAGSQATPPSQPASPNSPNTEESGSATGSPSTPSGSTGSTTPPKQQNTPTDPKVMWGGYHFFTGKGQKGFFEPNSDETELTIDGKKLSLVLGKVFKKEELKNSYFGVYSPAEKGVDEDYVISIGKYITEDQMPQSGKFMYSGKAFYGSEVLKGWFDGTSEFAVDFGNKTVNGEIKAAGKTFKLPEVKIEGNAFEFQKGGNGNEEWVRGTFFGKDAAELGGVWERKVNGKGEGAVFGATKQP